MFCCLLTTFLLFSSLISSEAQQKPVSNQQGIFPKRIQQQSCTYGQQCSFSTLPMRMFDLQNFYNSYNYVKQRARPRNDFISRFLAKYGDEKRNVFFSKGWGASGTLEMAGPEDNQDKIKTGVDRNKVKYAFTSNHWGPLGKRMFAY